MPAMHDDVLAKMVEHLQEKLALMMRLVPFNITHEECINLVAPSEHIPILTQAAQVANINAYQNWMTLQVPAIVDDCSSPNVMLMMCTRAKKDPPLMPRNPWWQPPSRLNIPAGDKVIAWLTKRYEFGRKFGTAQYVLQHLNRECENGRQLRYMLPPVLHLCKAGANVRMDTWMVKHAAYKPCRYAPALSPQLKRAVQDTAALLTSAMLIGDEVPERLPEEVDILEYAMPGFEINGVAWPRM